MSSYYRNRRVDITNSYDFTVVQHYFKGLSLVIRVFCLLWNFFCSFSTKFYAKGIFLKPKNELCSLTLAGRTFTKLYSYEEKMLSVDSLYHKDYIELIKLRPLPNWSLFFAENQFLVFFFRLCFLFTQISSSLEVDVLWKLK